jgi:peptidoglycan/LPS O-acetylase OafA/YrhL
MIQRIQSVYLSGVAVIGVVLFLVPFGTIDGFTLTATELSNSKEVLKQTYPLAVVIGFGLLVALASIFTFKNRKLQIKLCTLSMINQAAILALAMFLYLDGTATELGDEKPTYAIGIYMPVIGMVLSFLASKAIKKDEDLVKSVDRLR